MTHQENVSPAVWQPFAIVVATLIAGTAFLRSLFTALGDTLEFVALSSAVAAVWTLGWLLLRRVRPAALANRLATRQTLRLSVVVGVIVSAAFVLGTLVLLRIDGLSDAVYSAIVGAESTELCVTFAMALATGATEELFFRCALPRLWSSPVRGHMISGVLYTMVTAATLNVALIAAAPILAAVSSWAYLKTSRIMTPLIIHGMWTVVMVGLLPLFAG